ncbi:MAG: DUF3419 family protein [Pseudomonadota bacterium]
MAFFKRLNFSSSNEDGATEVRALRDARRILCITGSGTRPLDLLQTNAEEVIAFDVNPVQNALLALKLAAIARFDHAEYLTFLGISDGDCKKLYAALRGDLDPGVRSYWDGQRATIAQGVWHAGKWERMLHWNAKLLHLFRGRAVDALMSAPSVEAQAAIWAERFSDGRLRRAIEVVGQKWIWRWVLREPGGAFLPGSKAVGTRLERDFAQAAGRFLFRESEFATLIFRGRTLPGGALPLHMTPETYAHTKANLQRLRIVEGHLTELDAAGMSEVDGFSLSDFSSYTDAAAYAACWSGILQAAAPGARFCERIFMNDLALPSGALSVDAVRSETLTQADRAIIYRIRCGTIDG